MDVVETTELRKEYNAVEAVAGIDLKIKEGEVYGLLGPNGAGKTTTLLMLTTLIPPTSGSAKIDGLDIRKQAGKVRKKIGIVFQDPSSDDILTGYENLKLHGWLYDMPDQLKEDRIQEVLKLVDLTQRKDDLVKKYSGGMRRRLEIARGLMHHPKVLFLDEPTLGLDPQAREKIWKYIEELARKENITVILTTHYMEEADQLCDRVAIIDHGKIVAEDTPENLKKQLGGDIVRIKAKDLDLGKLRQKEYIQKIAECDGELQLTVDKASEHLQDLLNSVGKIESVEVRTPTLEDVFMHHTGREMREGSPEGGWGERAMHVRKS